VAVRASAREDKTLGQVALSAAFALTLTVGTPSEPAFARATSPAAQRAGVESAAAVTPDFVKKESAFKRVQVSRQAQAGLYEFDDSLSGALASRYGAVAPTRPESNPFKGTEIQKKKEQATAPAPKAFGAKPAAAPKPAAAKPAAASSDKVSRFDPTIVIGAAAVVGLAAYSATNKPSGDAKSTPAAKPAAKAATAKKTPEQNAAEAQEWIDNWKPSGKAKDNTAEAQEWIDNWKKNQK
jgi:histone H1/5